MRDQDKKETRRRGVNRLSARWVAVAPPGRYADGRNLYLHVRPNGRRSWVLRYVYHGRRRDMGLGPWPIITLKRARELALDWLRVLHEGRDPIAERRAGERQVPTFREAAEDYVKAHASRWSNPKHRAQWTSTLKTYAYPALGSLRVDEIGVDDVLRALRPIWEEKAETASRVRGRIERVLDWCTVLGLRDGPNPARWKGNLQALLPARGRRAHFRAMPWAQVPEFVVGLRRKQGMAARALEFAILTAARSGEVRGATWDEIDLEAKVWTIPAERMKSKREHRVPLSDEAVRLLKALPLLEGTELVFPSPMTGRQLSDMSLTKVLRDMGVSVTVHGFRSSFRDWCAETTAYPSEVAEAALAHVVRNQVEAAYRRGDLFEKRRQLMQEWGTFCTTPRPAGEVVPIRGGR